MGYSLKKNEWCTIGIPLRITLRIPLRISFRYHSVLCVQKNVVNSLLKKAKRSYYVGLIEDCGDDSKQLFSVANRLLNRKQSSPLPSHTDSSAMAETFIKYFRTKVKTISDSLCPDESSHESLTSASLEILKPTDTDEVQSPISPSQITS